MSASFENAANAQTMGIQSAFFWQGLDLSQPLELANRINASLSFVFDGEPAVLPPPQPKMPRANLAGIPRIILGSSDGRYKCNISALRADFIFAENSPQLPTLASVWEDYGKVIGVFMDYLRQDTPAAVVRLGIIFRLFRKLEGSANDFIHQKFLRDNLFEPPFEINLNLLNKTRLDRFGINRWIRLRALRNKQNPGDDTALMLEIDINTLTEEQHALNIYEIERFFETSYERLCTEDIKYLFIN